MEKIAIILLAISLFAVQSNFAWKVGKNVADHLGGGLGPTRDGVRKDFAGRLVKTSSGRIFLALNHPRGKAPKLKKNRMKSDYGAFRTYTTGPPSKWNSAKPEAKERRNGKWKKKPDTWKESLDNWKMNPNSWNEKPRKWDERLDTWEEKPGKWKEKRDKWEEKSDTRKSLPKTGAGWIKKVSWGELSWRAWIGWGRWGDFVISMPSGTFEVL